MSLYHSISPSLYSQIKQVLPIPCVDLLLINKEHQVLMVKRKNAPAKGLWWFPGGRILFGEMRPVAAVRKLKEECGLQADDIRELGTYDVFLDELPNGQYHSHAITTVFVMHVTANEVHLDEQSESYLWKSKNDWLKKVNNEFLVTVLNTL